jgi:hypothetical protein
MQSDEVSRCSQSGDARGVFETASMKSWPYRGKAALAAAGLHRKNMLSGNINPRKR